MKKTLLIILILLSIHFWQLRFIPQIYNGENLLCWAIAGICMVMLFNDKQLHFKNAIYFFFLGVGLNTLAAYFNFGQSPKATILAFSTYYFILFYFFMHKMQFETKYLENVIIVFAAIYSFLYIAQIIALPHRFLSSPIDASRGTIRMRIEGNGFLMLAYFMLLNRFLLKRNLINLAVALLFFVVLFLGGFRTLAFAALLLSFFMFIRLTAFNIRDYLVFAVIVLMFFGLFQIEGIQRIVSGMVESTQDVIASGENYIRLKELNFFYKVFPKNIIVFLLGSGLPGGYSPYYMYVASFEWNMGYYWSDIGLLGLLIMIGPIALGGILWYTFKAMFTKVPKEMIYLNMYFAYLFFVSFTTMEIFRDGMFSVQAIGLYLIDRAINDQKKMVSTGDENTIC